MTVVVASTQSGKQAAQNAGKIVTPGLKYQSSCVHNRDLNQVQQQRTTESSQWLKEIDNLK